MSDAASAPAEPTPGPPVPRARPYLRVLWLVPALAMLAVGWHAYRSVEPGGVVQSVRVKTRTDFAGQASDTIALLRPGTPDLYLKVETKKGSVQTRTYPNMPIGSGLRWDLPEPIRLADIQRVEVWDDDPFSDTLEDHVTPDGWGGDGQKYRVDLVGTPYAPPQWALPLATAGAVVTLIVVMVFVKDQVV